MAPALSLRAQISDLAFGHGRKEQCATEIPVRAEYALAIHHEQPSFLRIGQKISGVRGEIAHERLSIIQCVAEQMVNGGRLIHATLRKRGERIGIGGIEEPAMRPQRRQLIQLAIERDV